MTEPAKSASLIGLNWGHRRAIAPLVDASNTFAADNAGATAEWSVRSLQAFEHQPIDEAAKMCDLLVFDHPFTGEIAESGLFLALDDIIGSAAGANSDGDYIGPSLRSYRWHGKTWGAPIDGATMHAIYRKDLLDRLEQPLPKDWQDVIRLGRTARGKGLWMGMANGDHHGFLAAGSLMHNCGVRWTKTPEGSLTFDIAAFEEVLDALAEFAALSHPDCGQLNSIALHDAMTSRDDIVYCPSVFGYATYGEEDHGSRRLSFGPSPGLKAPYEAGTLVGGTAVAISAHCKHQEFAKRYVAFLLRPETQMTFARHHGQPALIGAWNDPTIDAAFNGYFSAIRTTIESAAIRPRFKGYGIFERKAGIATGAYLRGEKNRAETIDIIRALSDQWTAPAA